ncbi:MAG: hypothetical protein H7A33_02760 [Deltaproteobacteria bacterium]|nr:hypothetical protein [Deltaproteobacteria bacterium]
MIDFLLLTKDERLQEAVKSDALSKELSIQFCDSYETFLDQIDTQPFGFVFVDLEKSATQPLPLLEWLETCQLPSKIGVICEESYGREVLASLRLGVDCVLSKENLLQNNSFVSRLQDLLVQQQDALADSFRPFVFQNKTEHFVVCSEHSRHLHDRLRAEQKHHLPLLLQGEIGVGKSFFVKALAADSCFSDLMIFDVESKDQSAFFSQQLQVLIQNSQKKSGPLLWYFPEIQKLTAELQEVLAQYLSSGEFLFNGLACVHPVKIVASYQDDFEDILDKNKFKEDLYWHFAKRTVSFKSISQRKEDLKALLQYWLSELWKQEQQYHYLSLDALESLMDYNWEQNISGLRQAFDQMIQNAKQSMVTGKALPEAVLVKSYYCEPHDDLDLSDLNYNDAKKRMLNNFHRDYIFSLLKKSNDNLTVAAEKAEMDRSNFKKIIKKYELM